MAVASTSNLIKLTSDLIRFKTVSKAKNSEATKCFRYIDRYLSDSGVTQHSYSFEGFEARIYTNFDFEEKHADFIMHGHLDVVPGSQTQFIPKVTRGKLFGRGALDMKSGLACCIESLKNNAKSNKRLILMITSDEEIGSKNGTEKLFATLGLKGKFFLTAEGETDYLLKYKQKGVLWLNLNAKSKGGHSSYPDAVNNPVIDILDAYQILKAGLIDESLPSKWRTSVCLSKISGGEAYNSISTTAQAGLDIRYCEPFLNMDMIRKKVSSLLRNTSVVFEEVLAASPMLTDPKDKSFTKFVKLCEKNMPKVSLYLNSGTNDARFAAEKKIPSVAIGPIGKNYHADNEYVEVDSMYRFFTTIDEFIKVI